jgi:hypothetical protein
MVAREESSSHWASEVGLWRDADAGLVCRPGAYAAIATDPEIVRPFQCDHTLTSLDRQYEWVLAGQRLTR